MTPPLSGAPQALPRCKWCTNCPGRLHGRNGSCTSESDCRINQRGEVFWAGNCSEAVCGRPTARSAPGGQVHVDAAVQEGQVGCQACSPRRVRGPGSPPRAPGTPGAQRPGLRWEVGSGQGTWTHFLVPPPTSGETRRILSVQPTTTGRASATRC